MNRPTPISLIFALALLLHPTELRAERNIVDSLPAFSCNTTFPTAGDYSGGIRGHITCPIPLIQPRKLEYLKKVRLDFEPKGGGSTAKLCVQPANDEAVCTPPKTLPTPFGKQYTAIEFVGADLDFLTGSIGYPYLSFGDTWGRDTEFFGLSLFWSIPSEPSPSPIVIASGKFLHLSDSGPIVTQDLSPTGLVISWNKQAKQYEIDVPGLNLDLATDLPMTLIDPYGHSNDLMYNSDYVNNKINIWFSTSDGKRTVSSFNFAMMMMP